MKPSAITHALVLLLALPGTSSVLLAEEVDAAATESADLNLGVEDCTFPVPPVIPDGATVTEEELRRAAGGVREYQVTMEASLACIDEAEAALGEEITEEQKSALNTLYNNGYEQLTTIADSFNQQLRIFRARPPAN